MGEHGVVHLVAKGYEWVCPVCGTDNNELCITDLVECSKCENRFEVGDVGNVYD